MMNILLKGQRRPEVLSIVMKPVKLVNHLGQIGTLHVSGCTTAQWFWFVEVVIDSAMQSACR